MIPSLGHQISNFYVAKYSFSEKLAAVFSSFFVSIERLLGRSFCNSLVIFHEELLQESGKWLYKKWKEDNTKNTISQKFCEIAWSSWLHQHLGKTCLIAKWSAPSITCCYNFNCVGFAYC